MLPESMIPLAFKNEIKINEVGKHVEKVEGKMNDMDYKIKEMDEVLAVQIQFSLMEKKKKKVAFKQIQKAIVMFVGNLALAILVAVIAVEILKKTGGFGVSASAIPLEWTPPDHLTGSARDITPSFYGFSCSDIKEAARVQIREDCDEVFSTETAPKEVKLSMLQKVTEREVEGHLCQKKTTKQYLYCGVFSTQEMLLPDQTEIAQDVSIYECMDWIDHGFIEDLDGNAHMFPPGGGEIVTWEVAVGATTYNAEEVTCDGEDTRIKNKIYSSVL